MSSLQVSLNVGNPPASTMFSYAVLNDDRQHAVELLLDGKNLTMRVDGGLARSLINLGSKVFESDKSWNFIICFTGSAQCCKPNLSWRPS